jgi:Sugar phosphate permease
LLANVIGEEDYTMTEANFVSDSSLRPELLIVRLERLPMSRSLIWMRVIIGFATLFDGFETLAIAFVMPVLIQEWHLAPVEVGAIISIGYVGQLVGALFFGWLAERWGRLHCLLITVLIFTAMSLSCVFAWSGAALMAFRFVQGIGTGGEVPIASAYINEFIGAKNRGKFFLLYEVLFPVGLMLAGLIGYAVVPHYGWRAMFIIGVIPALVTIPLRFFLPESPRWLLSKGHVAQATAVVERMEREVEKSGQALPPVPEIAAQPAAAAKAAKGKWTELFSPFYLPRTLMIWVLWLSAYMINNGMTTWLPSLYKTIFKLPLDQSLFYGFCTQACGVATSIICAFFIDRVGRRKWYITAFGAAVVPLAVMSATGVVAATQVWVFCTIAYACLQTVTFSLYLYSAELYPTRIRAIGNGFGSAWLRLGSALGPVIVGTIVAGNGISWVFTFFATVAFVAAVVCWRFMIETRGRVLEEVSP